ncbi:MAG: hypothetical protein ACP5U0_09770 [Caldisphaera sp.]
MRSKEKIKVRIKRISGLIYVTLIVIAIFIALLMIDVFNYIDLRIFVSSFIGIIGVLFGLTFTSYAILLSVTKSINKTIRTTNGFGVIGYILFLTVILEIVTLGIGLSLLTVKNLTNHYAYYLGCGFILFSLTVLSYIILIVYYMTLVFNRIRFEE